MIAVLAAYSVLADAATTEARTGSRVLDRTFACSVAGTPSGGYPDPIPAGPRHLRLTIAPEVRESWRISPAALAMRDREGNKVVISPGFEGVVKIGNERFRPAGILSVDRKTCRPVTDTRIPLSRRGLRTRPDQFDQSIECRVPARIVFRVRAELRRPASLIVRGGKYVLTSTTLVRVEVAVTTFPARKPIVYAHIARNGTTALFASSSCVRT